jgi:hypothetical protein
MDNFSCTNLEKLTMTMGIAESGSLLMKIVHESEFEILLQSSKSQRNCSFYTSLITQILTCLINPLMFVIQCLTTGDPGDVVAAAFNKREDISLVLAKNGQVTAADYNVTRFFLPALMAATDWIDLLRIPQFLVNHGKTDMDKRIRSLRQFPLYLRFRIRG